VAGPLAYARSALRGLVFAGLARAVSGAGDARLERQFGSEALQRVLFEAVARSFRPDLAEGFEGTLVYELTRPATDQPSTWWTIEIRGRRATARAGAAADPAVGVRIRVSDFVRVGAGAIDPAQPLLAGRATFVGELRLAVRVPEMFGLPTPKD
jgi:hypothetical protein